MAERRSQLLDDLNALDPVDASKVTYEGLKRHPDWSSGILTDTQKDELFRRYQPGSSEDLKGSDLRATRNTYEVEVAPHLAEPPDQRDPGTIGFPRGHPVNAAFERDLGPTWQPGQPGLRRFEPPPGAAPTRVRAPDVTIRAPGPGTPPPESGGFLEDVVAPAAASMAAAQAGRMAGAGIGSLIAPGIGTALGAGAGGVIGAGAAEYGRQRYKGEPFDPWAIGTAGVMEGIVGPVMKLGQWGGRAVKGLVGRTAGKIAEAEADVATAAARVPMVQAHGARRIAQTEARGLQDIAQTQAQGAQEVAQAGAQAAQGVRGLVAPLAAKAAPEQQLFKEFDVAIRQNPPAIPVDPLVQGLQNVAGRFPNLGQSGDEAIALLHKSTQDLKAALTFRAPAGVLQPPVVIRGSIKQLYERMKVLDEQILRLPDRSPVRANLEYLRGTVLRSIEDYAQTPGAHRAATALLEANRAHVARLASTRLTELVNRVLYDPSVTYGPKEAARLAKLLRTDKSIRQLFKDPLELDSLVNGALQLGAKTGRVAASAAQRVTGAQSAAAVNLANVRSAVAAQAQRAQDMVESLQKLVPEALPKVGGGGVTGALGLGGLSALASYGLGFSPSGSGPMDVAAGAAGGTVLGVLNSMRPEIVKEAAGAAALSKKAYIISSSIVHLGRIWQRNAELARVKQMQQRRQRATQPTR